MERARNVEALEALAEEDDEEEVDDDKKNRDLTKEPKEHKPTDQLPVSNTKKKKPDSSDTDSSDDEEPDSAAQRDPNKFDNLCDGVLGAMALVHGSLRELLEMKDEMLKHALPPPLLIKMATITGKVFRSVSDLNMPVNELVRLVHVYSTPWEEKSTALKKLHEDYESKQRQLNIAIKRLQLVDAHSKRIAREKRIMNWEKLFAKIMSNKGHGRRWKFLIETIKQKAKLGLEHVQEYTKSLEESSGEEEEEEEEIPISLKRQGDNNSEKLSDLEEGEEEEGGGEESEKAESEGGEEDADPEAAFNVEESDDTTDAVTSRAGSSKKVRFAPLNGEGPSESPKVTTQEVSTWTEEPEYDSFLFVRVFAPQDMQEKEIKCRVSCGEQNHMTSRLDPEETAPVVEEKPKGKGLMGTKGKALEKKTAEKEKLEKKKKEEEKAAKARYEEMSFDLPEEVPEGVLALGKKPNQPENLQIAVHCGPAEELFAMATIEWDFIKTSIDPQIVYLPEPHGDDDVPSSPRAAGKSDVGDYDSHSVDVETTSLGDQRKKPAPPKPDLVKDAKPVSFPLFSVNPGKDMHDACGNLPLIIYIGKRLRPKVFNRQSETMTMNQLVFDLAGIDLDNWNKEDLNKEFREQASSVVGFPPEVKEVVVEKEVIKEVEIVKLKTPPPPPTPPKPETPPPPSPKEEEPKEDVVPKAEFEQLIQKHNEDLHMVQQEYEARLQELMENLQKMEQSRTEMQQQIQQQQQLQQQAFVHQRPVSQQSSDSGGKRRHGASGDKLSASTPSFDKIPQPPRSSPLRPATVPDQIPPPPIRPRKVVRPSKPSPFLGTDIPEDFLDRLQYFEEESNKHKMEMINKISQQIQSDIEKKLAGQHKLSKKEEEMYSALHDVSLPALFMPYKRGTVYNPRAHQYFHPTGSTDMRLSQPPSMFQLPPLPHKNRMSVLNLFDLSRNFNARGQAWLMERYIQQQEPVANVHGMVPQTPAPTSAQNGSPEMVLQERQSGALHDTVQSIQGTSTRERELEVDM